MVVGAVVMPAEATLSDNENGGGEDCRVAEEDDGRPTKTGVQSKGRSRSRRTPSSSSKSSLSVDTHALRRGVVVL